MTEFARGGFGYPLTAPGFLKPEDRYVFTRAEVEEMSERWLSLGIWSAEEVEAQKERAAERYKNLEGMIE